MPVFWGTYGTTDSVAQSTASSAASSARSASRTARELEERLDRALLACEAMWTILRDKLSVTDVELLNRINEIDLSDGKLDGKVRRPAVACPKCGRTIARRFPKCMYCGQAVMHDPFT